LSLAGGRRLAVFALLLALVAAARAGSEPRVIELAVKNGQLPEDRRLLQVKQGDDVTLRWTTDRPLTVHLHGYDLETKLAPGAPVSVRFTARATGRFAIEVHGDRGEARTLAYLEVHPR
jgi:hypothetical protein